MMRKNIFYKKIAPQARCFNQTLVHLAILVPPVLGVAIRPVTFENGVPTASSVIENSVSGQALWDTRMTLDRSKVNVLVRDLFCPYFCQWLPEFISKTGIDIAIHCHGSSLSSLSIARSPTQSALSNEEAWKICEPFGGNIYILPGGEERADLSQGFLGGFDVYYATFGNILLKLTFGDAWSAEPPDVAADLSPFLSISDFDWLAVRHALREISCTYSTAVVALPNDVDALTLVPRTGMLICLLWPFGINYLLRCAGWDKTKMAMAYPTNHFVITVPLFVQFYSTSL